MNRELWINPHAPNDLPQFPCGVCNIGVLLPIGEKSASATSSYSTPSNNPDDWDPTYLDARFTALLKCSKETCGAVSAVVGDVIQVEEITEHGWGYSDAHKIDAVTPAPMIITLPNEMPDIVEREIKISFKLYWIDLASCANRLRISVERILDDIGIPTVKTGSNGKVTQLKLYDRIKEYKLIEPENATTMDALRFVGNVGSHEGSIARETILDAYEIYEDTLSELYGKKSIKMATMKAKLIAAKGK